MNRYSSRRLAEFRQALRAQPPINPLKWKRHQLGLLLQAVRKDRARFIGLRTIDATVKRSIYPTVRRAINRLYVSQSPQSFEQLIILVVIGLVPFAPAGWLLYQWAANLLGGPDINSWLVAVGFAIAYASIFFLPKSGQGYGAVTGQYGAVAPVWLSIYPVILIASLAAASPWAIGIPRGWWFSPLYSLIIGAGGMSAFVLIIGVAATPALLVIARRLRRNTDARILTKIVALMDDTERYPRQWEELSFRAHLAKELDAIASLIENALPAAYSNKDELFRRWMSARSRRIATHLRDLKSWLAIPRKDTREYFLQALGQVVICLGRGDWDGIPAAAPSSEGRRAGRIATLLSAVRTLSASVLPAAILVLLHVLHRDPPSQISGYLAFGAAAWLTVGCISLLDPLYSSRLEAFKSALQFLPGLKKD
jgi:hypothetical protein